MSAKVKLAGKLPGDEPVNGIDLYAEDLCDRWDADDAANPPAVLVIGVVRLPKPKGYQTVRDDDGLHRIPTIEVTRLEVLGVLGKEPTGKLVPASAEHQQLLLKVAESRTGADPLPIDAASAVDNHQVL